MNDEWHRAVSEGAVIAALFVRLDEGFHSKAERNAARAAGRPPVRRLSKAQNIATPVAFRDVLLELARGWAGRRAA